MHVVLFFHPFFSPAFFLTLSCRLPQHLQYSSSHQSQQHLDWINKESRCIIVRQLFIDLPLSCIKISLTRKRIAFSQVKNVNFKAFESIILKGQET